MNDTCIMMSALGVCVALIAIMIASRVKRSIGKVSMIVVALVGLLPSGVIFVAHYPESIDGRFRTYKRFYQGIQIGMTHGQVLEVMAEHYPANGPRKRPRIIGDVPHGLDFFMNPENSREPNCEGIFLTMESGIVTKKSYSED